MKIVRFISGRSRRSGLITNGEITEVKGNIFGDYQPGARKYELKNVRLINPCTPSKIVAVGLNYRDHAQELGLSVPPEPMLFLKPGTSVIGPGESIVYPRMSGRVDYEAELGVVIKKRAKDVEEKDSLEYILGYTCFNDVTARDLQAKDVQYTRAKGFDTFAPLGPWIVTDIEPGDLKIELRLNGERKQSSRTSQLIFGIPQLVSFVSRVMTLLPGDLIATGTPSGIGPMEIGDTVEVEVEGIGTLRNTVEGE
jgi:2-keto-4-pentenoate hydratase/2-oxohepta-3-ene-1,7-dioic acid hydratase in catechol pathway